MIRRKEKPKRRAPGVPPKRQPAPPRDAHFVRTDGKEPEVLEPILYKFMA